MSSTAAILLVSEDQVLSTGYATIAMTTAFTIARFAVRWTQQKREFQIEDGICLFSWVAFLVMAILYIVVTPVLFRVDTAISTGELYANLMKDALYVTEIFFANTMIFWIVLWSVKLSLLFLYRRLFVGLPDQMKWWWSVLIFTVLVCVLDRIGECSTHRDAVAQVASLYFSFAVDVITDLMIMLLPWKLIWLLRLPFMEKVALGGVFGVGLVCVIMAIVRTVSVGIESRSDNTPSSSWLMLWGLIETAIAVVVGTLPAFAIFFRRQQHSRRYGSYPNGSDQRDPTRSFRSGSDRAYHPSQKIKLNTINVTRTLVITRSSHSNDNDNDMDMDEDPLHNSYPR
ncbi:conserved hypothetical protein [Talaromyces stipitatus ATCC 10500]|uniref:Rhodopsin domain-containing protein n=1 Tax=Talaromyces stipitatus (strain ATCC 10500 / CBS 375.48 / QM 6759 / NRRL 1006) TaxID=441959 RepID=B8MT69_TALSN|nr:uncharacterized protein TSTA_002320 [Talaromyces stipitatus ATCC 10500]EED12166.1 conserved hypothetical protein [Talaromyces stipitatus ATCC 10500]